MSTMVMTGGTSGFGAIAAERLTLSGNARLILGARRPTSVGESIPLDLTELDSVRAFATSVRERLGDTPVDALVLNAGVVLPDVTGRTVDGFETTFAVNHLAHYLLLRLLLPVLADRAIVVLTTSGTHDPATKRRAWRRRVTPTRSCWRTPIATPTVTPGRARQASTRTPRPSCAPYSPHDRCPSTPTSRPGDSPWSPTTRGRCSGQDWPRTCRSPCG